MLSLPTKILPKAIFDSVKRTRPIHDVGRRARLALGSGLGARYVAGLGGKAHYNDFMLSSTRSEHVDRYRRGAVEFVDILSRTLTSEGRQWADVWTCLDVGCGYGRIIRELRHKLPSNAISVCDVNDEAACFTAAEFEVRRLPIVEMMGPERNKSFDLIFLLGLYTHLDRPMIEMNLAKVAALAKPGGLIVFTTQGRSALGAAGGTALDMAKLKVELDQCGLVHERSPYGHARTGQTWVDAEEMERIVMQVVPDLELVAHDPLAVDGNQDVFVYRKG